MNCRHRDVPDSFKVAGLIVLGIVVQRSQTDVSGRNKECFPINGIDHIHWSHLESLQLERVEFDIELADLPAEYGRSGDTREPSQLGADHVGCQIVEMGLVECS